MARPIPATEPRAPRFRGVYSVLATPFKEDGTIDVEGLRRVVEHQIASGVAGVVCFGLASEVYKLDDREREIIIHAVVEQVAGRVAVVAGAEHTGTEVAAARCAAVRDAGATAAMLFPPSLVKPDRDGVIRYYEAAAAASLPIVVQDAPAWTGVPLPVDLLCEVVQAVPEVVAVKVEAPPTPPKIGALLSAGLECLGGYGTLYLLEELDRGVLATMPGCAFPAAHVAMLRLFDEGSRDEAAALFNQLLPLTVFAMSSLDVFVALQKRLLHESGLIESQRMRSPSTLPDHGQYDYMSMLIRETDVRRFLA